MANKAGRQQLLSVDKINLGLPASFASRAESIVKLLTREMRMFDLQALGVSGKHHMAHLSIPKLELDEATSDVAIARKIARVIGQQINQHFSGSLQKIEMDSNSTSAADTLVSMVPGSEDHLSCR